MNAKALLDIVRAFPASLSSPVTPAIAKGISAKNARAWVSMVSYLKKTNKNQSVKEKK